MAPVVHGLESEYAGRVNFVYLDVDDPNTKEFQQALGRRAQPEFYLLDGEGNVLKQWFGRVTPEDFEAAFAEALAGS
jgi:thioredoxin-related protein